MAGALPALGRGAKIFGHDRTRWRRELATLDKNLPRGAENRERLLTVGAAYIAAGVLHKRRGNEALSEWMRSLFPGPGFSAATVGRDLKTLRECVAISNE
jgi:hypothetical protein